MKNGFVRALICMVFGLGLFACSNSDSINSSGVALTSIAVTPVSPSVTMGASQQFTATGTYSDGTTQDITNSVSWSSADRTVATISNATGSNGLAISAVSGSTMITATSSDKTGSTALSVVQGSTSSLAGSVTTIAGVAPGSADGIGAAAHFSYPYGITTDGSNLYVADSGNYTIRKIVIATGEVSTLAGLAGSGGIADGTGSAARFAYPFAMVTDGWNLYVTDSGNNNIRKIVIATGQVTTLAGNAGSYGAGDGTGTAARFNCPQGITMVGTNLYVADTANDTIRKIVIATGQVTTLAGTAGSYGSTDGTGTAARFSGPRGITTDGTNLYVADIGNYTIRKIVIATGEVTTFTSAAGPSNSADGIETAARFYNPEGITTDGMHLYITDNDNNTIRKIAIETGQETTIAGTAGLRGSMDGFGSAASFYSPEGITTDGTNLYITDTNCTIRKIAISTGQVITVAGTASPGSSDGPGTAARFNGPSGITSDGTNLYITDSQNYTIRKIAIRTGEVSTIAGTAGSYGSTDGIGAEARFYDVGGITTDGTNLYAADTSNCIIRKIVIATGQVTTLAGTAGYSGGSTDGTGVEAIFNGPRGMATDGTNLYVADTWNHTIRKIVLATGQVTTLAGIAGLQGSADGTGSEARFKGPAGLTTDGTNLYVTDDRTIRQIVIATGEVSTIAGTAESWGTTDGIGAAARFNTPCGITTDGTYLYVTDTSNQTIRKILIATREVFTIAGTPLSHRSADGTGTTATFKYPVGITTNGSSFYITDSVDNTIRRVQE